MTYTDLVEPRFDTPTGTRWFHFAATCRPFGMVTHSSPHRSSQALEQKVVQLRRKHCSWGGRKIKRRLENLGEKDICSGRCPTDS